MNLLVTTMASGYFTHYAPMWEYSLKKATGYDCQVFTKCDCDVRYPNLPSTTNALRFLVDDYVFKQYDYVFFCDIDFIFLTHDPSFGEYYEWKMKKWGECYWSYRGPKRMKASENRLKRIAGGCFFASKEWFEKTKNERKNMLELVKSGEIGARREDDEVMLWKICARSGLKCPTKRGNKRKAKYKEIHIGDFKFQHRRENWLKMKNRITTANMLKWFRLQEDPGWRDARAKSCKCKEIREQMRHLDEYMEARREEYRAQK